jgi:hypothetical protein
MPCLSFIGRQDVIERLENFFFTNQPQEGQRRMFALCGLGMISFFHPGLMLTLHRSLPAGSGKTETTLHFVRRNVSKYKTGVIPQRSIKTDD